MLARGIGVLGIALVVSGLVVAPGCGPGTTPDFSKVEFTPEKMRTGPEGEEFNSDSFRIVRVLRQPKQLSAFGWASLYDDTREVGRMDEGQKNLPPEQRGERIIFSWRYTGPAGAAALARIELVRQHDTEPVVIEERYASLTRGRHRIAYNNRGGAYTKHGPVMRWRFQLISKDTVVAEKQSSLWGAMAGGVSAGTPSAGGPPPGD
jgi:hypothetical protein